MHRTVLHILLVVVACALVFSNTLENGFHLDDAYRVQNNPGVEEFWPPWRHFVDPSTSSTTSRLVQYRPLLPLSLSINYAISGDSLVGYHVGNLLLQILASVAVYFLVRELLGHWLEATLSPHAPLLVALMFAVHPVSGIPVNYICTRDLPLMQMFLMATLLCYARMRRLGETRGRWALCLGLLLLSLLSKKNGVVFPALVLLFELLPAGRSIRDGAVWRRVLTFAGAIALFLLFIRFGLSFSDYGHVVIGKLSVAEYASGQVQHHVFHYLSAFVWPFPIRIFPDYGHVAWQQAVGALCIIGSWAVAWRWRRQHPLVVFCLLSYQALLALTSSVLPLATESVPYRPYPSSVFLFLGAAVLVFRYTTLGVVALSATAIYFGASSFAMNPTWKDALTVWKHSIEHGGSDMAYTNYGISLPVGQEKVDTLRHAFEVNPLNAEADLALAAALVRVGNQAAGLARFREAVAREPDVAATRHRYAQALAWVGDRAEAAAQSAKATELDPHSLDYRCQAGSMAVDAGQNEAALKLLQPLLDRLPGYKITRFIAGNALFNLNHHAEAIQMLEAYVAQYETNAQAWFNLGIVRMAVGQLPKAIESLKRCLDVDSGFRDAHQFLAECYGRSGNQAAADMHARLFREGK